jgi:hypothetical protein
MFFAKKKKKKIPTHIPIYTHDQNTYTLVMLRLKNTFLYKQKKKNEKQNKLHTLFIKYLM